MHCCARNIERLTRIQKLRTDLQSRFVACSFHPLKSAIHELAIWPGPLPGLLSPLDREWPRRHQHKINDVDERFNPLARVERTLHEIPVNSISPILIDGVYPGA